MLPFSLQGKLTLADPLGVGTGPLIERLGAHLTEAKARNLSLGPDGVSFTGGIFRLVFNNWNLLGPINRGRVRVDAHDAKLSVSYRLGFAELFFGVLILTALAFAVAGWKLKFSTPGCVRFAALAFVWLYGMNVLIAVIRFRNMIRKAWGETSAPATQRKDQQ